MRLHGRLLVLTVALASVSCQVVTGSGLSREELEPLRDGLTSARMRLDASVSAGSTQEVGAHLRDLSKRLDDLEAKKNSFDVMERQKLSIAIATARHTITAAEQFVTVNDLDGVRMSVGPVQPSLDDVAGVLDRALRAAQAETGSP